MNVLALLLMAMMQSSTQSSNPGDRAQEGLHGLSNAVVPIDEIRQRANSGDYVPVPRSGLEKIRRRTEESGIPEFTKNRPQISSALYEATLEGSRMTSGQVELRFYEDEERSVPSKKVESSLIEYSQPALPNGTISDRSTGGPLLLGTTNLQQLRLVDDQGAVTIGSDASRRLFVLRSGVPTLLSGTWTADGLVAGNVIMFRFSLPTATTSKFLLHTAPGIQVSGVGSLVLGPEISESKSTWTLIPGDSTRLTISCRPQSDLKSQESLTLSGFTASHVASGEVLSSRWTIGLPTSVVQPIAIAARIPEGLRIREVSLEDQRPVAWSIVNENNHSLLKMLLPKMTAGAVIAISTESILPQSETWNLPMLSPSHWVSADNQYKGLILLPLSQISVVLPSTIKLDEWTLVGIQERDVVTRPDQSREYQLTQFLPEASAVVRTSTNQPRISEAIATIVEPAGRLATVRCLANVSCEAAPVVELKWPVTQGWQVIAVRYASNSRSLFFETSNVTSPSDVSLLTVHLPEALEPGASRLFEIQLQQTDNTDQLSLALPLQVIPEMERTASVVMFPPAFTLNTDLQQRWSMGRRSMTSDEMLQQMPWFPASRFLSGMQAFETGNAVSLTPQMYSPTPGLIGTELQLEHTIRIKDGLLIENSRIQIPAVLQAVDNLTVTISSNASTDLRWTVDGESVAARRVDDPDLTAEWKRWSIPLKNPRIGAFVVVRCESRRAVRPEFTATIPVPDSSLPLDGTLQLFASDEGLLSVSGLVRDSRASDPQLTTWKLPVGLADVHVQVDVNSGMQSGQAIDLHILHLISEESGSLHRELLAVANVARNAGQTSLPLALPEHLRPLVLVNGHRVQLQETPAGFSIPLPGTSADCQVIVRWTESASRSRRVTGERELPRLFLNELAVPQCTHHFLVDPELELKSPANPFAATEPAVISGILDRLLISEADGSRVMQSQDSQSVPAEIRQFIIQWQLAAVQGWQPQTLIDTVESKTAVIIQVTQLRSRLAITVGTFLLLTFGCIAFRNFAGRYRVPTAFLALGLLAVSVLVQTPVVNATLEGAFWGICVGLTLVMLSRWKWIRTPLKGVWIQACVTIVLFSHSGTGSAWQSSVPGNSFSPPLGGNSAEVIPQKQNQNIDVLVPDIDFSNADIVYVRRDLFERYQQDSGEQRGLVPAAVVTNLHARIVAEAANSLEVQLTLGVSAISGEEDTSLHIPLQGSHLVECRIDGVPILPEPFGTDSIIVTIPASSLLPSRAVEDSAFLSGGNNPAISTSVDAGSLDAFTVHTIECRLRPVTSRQTSGVQFRLPSLPCPEATIEVVCPDDLYSSARAQSSEGAVQWRPGSGITSLSSLGMSDGVDVRLLQNEIERGSPRSATVKVLSICETNAGQQMMTCICRFTKWNKLAPEVRYRVPAGFRLNTVSATTGADVITDLLWSVTDHNAVIQLPSGAGDSFVLAFQLVCLTAGDTLRQQVPVAELQQFVDCVIASELLLAVRTNSVFSVLPPQGEQVSTAAFPDLHSDWGQWLRRSDVVFRVPSENETLEISLIPRTSVNEVRISQNADIREGDIQWKCQIDVETSVLPVFRHRLALTSAVVINDVQVVAGEANRLDSWHRRGDQLVIQLKEGTTGAHSITLIGLQKIRPDDTTVSLHSPHLQNAQILESSMTVQDRDGLGLSIQKLGGAVPDTRVGPGDPLPPETPVRMQVVNETEPIVLVRARPVEPTGSLAAIRSADQVTFVLHVSQWSGSHGPLQVQFKKAPLFIREPFVLIEQKAMTLSRDEDSFVADQRIVREMFDQPEFTIIWTSPAGTVDDRQRSVSYVFPDLLHEIRWDDLFLVPLDASVGTLEHTAALKNAVAASPTWLSNAALSVGKEAELRKSGILNLPDGPDAKDFRILIPAPVMQDTGATETIREIVANTDTVVWSCSGQSAVGETLVLLYAADIPSKCLVKIPAETVVTEVETDESTRWDDGTHKSLVVDLLKPVTKLKLRWLGRRTEIDGNSLELHPPYPVNCVTRGFLTVFAENGTPRFVRPNVTTISQTALPSAQQADIDVSLLHAESAVPESGRSLEMLPSRDSLVRLQLSFRKVFLQRFEKTGRKIHASATCKLSTEHQEFSLSISQRGEMPAVFSLVAGLFVLSVAAFARNREASTETTLIPIDAQVIQVPVAVDDSSSRASRGDSARIEDNSASKSRSGVRPPDKPSNSRG